MPKELAMSHGKRIENFSVELKLGARRFKFPLCAKKERLRNQEFFRTMMRGCLVRRDVS
jgi:hypothetical protein